MTTQQINARDWQFQIAVGATPTWTDIAFVESFTLNNSDGEESTSTVTFQSGGVDESQAMQRGASLALSGKYGLDGTSHAVDPGQAAVEALAAAVGQASLGQVRFKHTSQTLWTVWTAWASLGEKAGGANDKTSWGCTFKRSGAASTM